MRNNIDPSVAGRNTNTAELIQTKRDLGRTKLAQETRRIQKAQKNVQLQTGGVLTVADGREMVQKRVESDVEKARKMVEAADQKALRTQNALLKRLQRLHGKEGLILLLNHCT